MVTLRAQAASVILGGRTVLDTVSLDVQPGHVLVIVGPNGAGKSTLLRALSGETNLSEGVVTLGGTPIADMSAGMLAQRRALMPQHASLSFPFKVRDVVAMGRAPFRHLADAEGDAYAVDWALDATDTRELGARAYTHLSGGEQQRTQLARVLTQIWRRAGDRTGRFLLLDEPTASLDLAHQHATLHMARELAAGGVGVVAVVHDLNLAALYADSVAVVSKGKMAALGHPSDVLFPDLIQTVFGLTVRRIHDPECGRHLILPTGHDPSSRAEAGPETLKVAAQ